MTTWTDVEIGGTVVSGSVSAAIVGSSIDNTPIGATTPSTGAFTTLTATTPSPGAFTTLTVSGAASFAAGTVGAPSIYLGGDTTTGLYRDVSNQISIALSGAAAGRILSSSSDLVLQGATTGTIGVAIGSVTSRVRIFTNFTNRWQWDVNGHYITFTDNVLDIGASGATRPRTGYFGTSVVIGSSAPGSTISQPAQNDTAVSNHWHAAFGIWVRSASNDRLTGFESTGAGGPLQIMVNNAEQARVLVVASAVNYATLAGGATTVGPTLSADGETNIDLQIASKGTGKLKLLTAGADIQWGKALVALGGGAAPTLGTIGGSGPATAAQNTWLRVLDSTGAAAWLPVWK